MTEGVKHVDFERIASLRDTAKMMRSDAELCARHGRHGMAERFAKEAALCEEAAAALLRSKAKAA
jgi:hypothetical protein